MPDLTKLLSKPPCFIELDGQRLAYTLCGAEGAAKPVLYLHGFPGSRLEATLLHAVALEYGWTVIAIDRPGFGDSDPFSSTDPEQRLKRFPELIERLASELKVSKFPVIAVSGGAPYGLALAALRPQMVSSLQIVSGIGEWTGEQKLSDMCLPNRITLLLSRYLPFVGENFAKLLGWWWSKDPRAMMLWLRAVVTEDDLRILSSRTVQKVMLENVRCGLKHGGSVGAAEVRLLAGKWGIPIESIGSHTTFWHGLADRYVPPSFAKVMSARIQGSDLKLLEDKGHFMAIELAPQILSSLR